MKKLLFALCLTALGVACRASGATMHDSSTCTGKDCADCAANKECTMEHKDCTHCTKEEMEKCPECKREGEVCPVTGKSTN
jgi:hypothetical protein